MEKIKMVYPIPYQGSKRKLAPKILEYFPQNVETLYEPFAGSAAVSLAAANASLCRNYYLSDVLPDLVCIWNDIINDPEGLSRRYADLWSSQDTEGKDVFFEIRNRFNQDGGSAELLFLIVRSVKNAVRFNSSGEFNQSMDKRRKGTKPDRMRKNILQAHALLSGRTKVDCIDYTSVIDLCGPNDLIYMDPPYQGTTSGRDKRYFQQLDLQRFIKNIEIMLEKNIQFLISFDGRCGERSYGEDLPNYLGLTKIELHAGTSSQSTLNGHSHQTYESLYISPSLQKTKSPERHNLQKNDLVSQSLLSRQHLLDTEKRCCNPQGDLLQTLEASPVVPL